MGAVERLRTRAAVVALRGTNWVARSSGRGSGTVVGGHVGLRIDRHLLHHLAESRTVVLVSGTNGKTTTTAFLRRGWGGDVASNDTGANMPAGHVATLATHDASRVVLEVDEAWLGQVIAATRPSAIVLLNLSRDQLDRANEVRQLAQRWRDALANFDGVVVANATDPLVVWAAEVAPRVRWCAVPTEWRADALSCPRCTQALRFEGWRWHCTCGFRSPETITSWLEDETVIEGRHVTLALSLPGRFNEANAVLALAALAELGEEPAAAATRLSDLADVAGRFGVRRYREWTVRLQLAKNPAGFSAMLATVPREATEVWIAINARIADGRDPSWLYDVPFEQLRGRRVRCLGDRALDIATRLDYADVDVVLGEPPVAREPSSSPVPVLANYTAFRDLLEASEPC